MKQKYRIVEYMTMNGEAYRVQYKWFWVWWNIKTSPHPSIYRNRVFNTEQAARLYITKLKNIDNHNTRLIKE